MIANELPTEMGPMPAIPNIDPEPARGVPKSVVRNQTRKRVNKKHKEFWDNIATGKPS